MGDRSAVSKSNRCAKGDAGWDGGPNALQCLRLTASRQAWECHVRLKELPMGGTFCTRARRIPWARPSWSGAFVLRLFSISKPSLEDWAICGFRNQSTDCTDFHRWWDGRVSAKADAPAEPTESPSRSHYPGEHVCSLPQVLRVSPEGACPGGGDQFSDVQDAQPQFT